MALVVYLMTFVVYSAVGGIHARKMGLCLDSGDRDIHINQLECQLHYSILKLTAEFWKPKSNDSTREVRKELHNDQSASECRSDTFIDRYLNTSCDTHCTKGLKVRNTDNKDCVSCSTSGSSKTMCDLNYLWIYYTCDQDIFQETSAATDVPSEDTSTSITDVWPSKTSSATPLSEDWTSTESGVQLPSNLTSRTTAPDIAAIKDIYRAPILGGLVIGLVVVMVILIVVFRRKLNAAKHVPTVKGVENERNLADLRNNSAIYECVPDTISQNSYELSLTYEGINELDLQPINKTKETDLDQLVHVEIAVRYVKNTGSILYEDVSDLAVDTEQAAANDVATLDNAAPRNDSTLNDGFNADTENSIRIQVTGNDAVSNAGNHNARVDVGSGQSPEQTCVYSLAQNDEPAPCVLPVTRTATGNDDDEHDTLCVDNVAYGRLEAGPAEGDSTERDVDMTIVDNKYYGSVNLDVDADLQKCTTDIEESAFL